MMDMLPLTRNIIPEKGGILQKQQQPQIENARQVEHS